MGSLGREGSSARGSAEDLAPADGAAPSPTFRRAKMWQGSFQAVAGLLGTRAPDAPATVSYTHLRAHETSAHL
eukprot:14658440-Alexandrium_andersonii.AAC.1